jgi:hypothetical protein
MNSSPAQQTNGAMMVMMMVMIVVMVLPCCCVLYASIILYYAVCVKCSMWIIWSTPSALRQIAWHNCPMLSLSSVAPTIVTTTSPPKPFSLGVYVTMSPTMKVLSCVFIVFRFVLLLFVMLVLYCCYRQLSRLFISHSGIIPD